MRIIILVIISVLFFSVRIEAQITAQSDTTVNSTLAPVEVVADKPVSAASSSYINKIDFENRPKNSAQDMLRMVPGLFIAQHAGGGKAEQIFVRGFDCDHGTDAAIFIDGMPVNMPSHGHGQGYADLHFLIPEVVQSMNIYKGPYSPQFGDFATGAAVQFNTVDTLDHNLIQVESGVTPNRGNITATRGLALLKLPVIDHKISSYVAADGMDNSGYFVNDQDFKRLNLFAKSTYAVNDHSQVHLSLSSFSSAWNASGQIPERAVSEGLISRFGSLDNSEGGSTGRNNLNLLYQTHAAGTEFEAQAYAFNYRFQLFSDFTFYLKDPVHGDEIEQDDNRTAKGLNAHYSFLHKLGNMDDKFTVGVAYRDDDIENQLWHVEKRQRLEAEEHALVNERSSGIYVSETFRFNDHLRIETGLRYDYFNFNVNDLLPSDSAHTNYTGINYQSILNPKVNLIYIPAEQLQLFLNAGSGFHSNDARSVVQASTHELPRAVGTETGALFHAGKRITISSALWWMELTDELVYNGDDGTTVSDGPSRRTGIDISIRYELTRWLYADADMNFSKSILIDKMYGSRLPSDYYVPLAPTATSAGGLTVKLPNGIEGGLRYRTMARRAANESNTVIATGYTVVDFNAMYKRQHYKAGIIIENLLNANWDEAQFDTTSRLLNESKPLEEIDFTPGTPLAVRVVIGYIF